MRQTPVNDYLEDISTEIPEEIYGRLSDAIYETTCEFDEEVGLLRAENAKLREQVDYMTPIALYAASERERDRMRELGIEVPA